jgi:hypothetical protein
MALKANEEPRIPPDVEVSSVRRLHPQGYEFSTPRTLTADDGWHEVSMPNGYLAKLGLPESFYGLAS